MSDVTYTSRELLTWLWRDYLKKHMWVLLVAIIFMSIEASTMGGLAKLMQPMFDQVFVAGEKGALLWVGLVRVGGAGGWWRGCGRAGAVRGEGGGCWE